MAYNGGYGSYSPYFSSQQPTDSNERGQYSYQNATGANDSGYQRPAFSAPNAALNNQQPPANTSYQNQRTDYGYNSSSRPSAGDTSALGNLAYASTLRQTSGDPIQRVADFNRQDSGVYDQGQGQGSGHNIQRSDSRGSRATSNLNSPSTSAQPYPTYPATTGNSNQQFSACSGNYGNYQESAYPPAPYGRQELDHIRRTSQHIVAPPSRPASGQSTHASRSQATQQVQNSPKTHAYAQAHPSSQLTQNASQQTAKSNAPSMTAQVSGPSSVQQTRSNIPNTSRTVTQNHSSRSSAASRATNHNRAQSGNRPQSTQLPPIQTVPSSQRSEIHAKSIGQQPQDSTVDPNQIFDHYEYERRQTEAETAKRKAAADAEETKRRAEAAKQAPKSALQQTDGTSSNRMYEEEVKKKEQMEAEMKLMLEKMREYKSKDPTLFSQIWESVKKAQPPGLSTKDPTQPPTELPASKEVTLPSPQVANKPSPSAQLTFDDTPDNVQQPADAELPDRGKFPASRRGRPRRKSRGGRSSLPATTHGEGSNETPSLSVNASTEMSATKQTPQQVWVFGKKAQYSPPVSQMAAGAVRAPPTSATSPSMPISSPMENVPSNASPTPSGQTLWPEEDKWNLANAAQNTLLVNPANRGKLISSTEIHNILNQGPSYEELCKILEAKGFMVDRTPFAQQLLAAVPKLKAGQSRQPEPATSTGANGTLAPTAPMFGQPRPGPPPPNGGMKPRRKSAKTNETETSGAPGQAVNSDAMDGMQQAVALPPPKPLSKQEQARKQTFGDIVDLTAEMSSDEELKRQRAEEMKKIEQLKQMQQVKAAMEAAMTTKAVDASAVPQRMNDPALPKALRMSPGLGLSSSAPPSDDDAVSGLSRFKSNAAPQQERLRKSREVIRPMNGRADALRRSTYNPRTVARDILVAAGKHPTMSALNYHLDPLRTNFRHVDYSSDLSTFNWALIDPGGPPIKPRVLEPEPVRQQDEVNDADDEEAEGEPSRRGQPGHSAATSIGNDIEDVVMIDAPPSGPAKGLFPASRGRGRPRGPGRVCGPRPNRGGFKSSFDSAVNGSPRQLEGPQAHPPSQSDVSMLGPGVSTTQIRPGPWTPSSSPAVVPEGHVSLSYPAKRKRGRPPKDRTPLSQKNSGLPPQSEILSQLQSRHQSHSPPHSEPIEANSEVVDIPEPTRIADHTSPSVREPSVAGSANTMQRPNANSTPARPSGLRNQITASPFAVVIPRSPNAGESVPSQSRQPKKVKTSHAPMPRYQIYRCRWKDCEGQLHNLETLRRHVRKHMSESESEDDLQCLWEGCGTTTVTASSDNARQPLKFKSETAWERHMEGRHLDRYAWELGDGPSPHASDAEVSDYISDSQKRQVTPLASPENPRPDSFNLATIPPDERSKVAKAYHAAHENKTEAQKAQAVFDNLKERRRKLGPGIERGGHKFVNDAKRALLEDQPELRKVDDDDDL